MSLGTQEDIFDGLSLNPDTTDVPNGDIVVDEKYKAKVERFKQTHSSDPKHVKAYLDRLKREDVDVSPLATEASKKANEKTRTSERMEDRRLSADIFNSLDKEFGGDNQPGIKQRGEINYDYTYENQTFMGVDFLNPDDNVTINEDNIDAWLAGEYKMGDERIDQVIDEQVTSQINAEYVTQYEENGFITQAYTDDNKLELRNFYKQQYKSDLQQKRSDVASNATFQKAIDSEIKNIEVPTELPLMSINRGVSLPGEGLEGEEYDVAIAKYQKGVAYNNLYENTINTRIEDFNTNNPPLGELYAAQEDATDALEEFELDESKQNSHSLIDANKRVEELRNNLGFGNFLKDEQGNYTVGDSEIRVFTELSESYQNELEFLYDLENPETLATLKNAWLKSTIHANELSRELKAKESLLSSTSVFDQQAAGIDKSRLTEGLPDLQRRTHIAQAKREALDHYYLLNHRYLESKEAKETHVLQHFGKGFAIGMGISKFNANTIFGGNEYTEDAALEVLNQYSIPITADEIENTELSGGEEVAEFMGDITALGVKLMAVKSVINPVFLGGGARAGKFIKASQALKNTPKLQRGLAYMAENGVLGAYYSSKVGAGRKFVAGTKLIDKLGILAIEGGMEEFSFQTIGGQAGQGFGFGIGHRLPLSLMGKWKPKTEFAAVFKRFTAPKLNSAISATASMEVAGISEAAWELLIHDDTFKEKFDELVPSLIGEQGKGWKNSLGRRLLFNLSMNALLSTSAAYNPYSIGNIIRRKKTYNPKTGEYGVSGAEQIVDQYKRDFTIRKDKLIEAINHFENGVANGGEVYADVIKELKTDLENVHNFQLTVDNYIFKKVIVDKEAFNNPDGESTLGVVENMAGDLMGGMINTVMTKPKNWESAMKRLVSEYNLVNKQLYDAEPINSKDLIDRIEKEGPDKFIASLQALQNTAETDKAKLLKRHGVVRETVFANGVRHRIRYNKRTQQYVQYFKRVDAAGKDKTLTDGEVKSLRAADVAEANKIFEYEKNRNLNDISMYGDGNTTGNARNVVEIGSNNISDRLKKARQAKEDGAKNSKTIHALETIRGLFRVMPNMAQSRFVLHSSPGSLNKVIKARAFEKRQEATSLFNQGIYTEAEFASEIQSIRDWSFNAATNPFISGAKNSIHIDVSPGSNVKKKDIGRVLGHEISHPLLNIIAEASPESYKALEQQMLSDPKYAKKYKWALEQYGFSKEQMQQMRLNVAASDVTELQKRQQTVLNETMAEWLGEQMYNSNLSQRLDKRISRPIYNAYRKLFGDAAGEIGMDFLSKNNVDPSTLTLEDLTDLSKISDKINRAIRLGNNLKFDASIPMPEEMSTNADHFNLINENALFNSLNKETLTKQEFNKLNNLIKARDMRFNGVSALKIHQETGMFVNRTGQIVSYEGPLHTTKSGKDGLVRIMEAVNESPAEGIASVNVRLDQLFDGPALLYYPKLKNMEIELVFDSSKKSVTDSGYGSYLTGGNFDGTKITIKYTRDTVDNFIKAHKESGADAAFRILNRLPGRKTPFVADAEYVGVLNFLDLSKGESKKQYNSDVIDAYSLTNAVAHEVQHYIQGQSSQSPLGGTKRSSTRAIQGLYINDSFAKDVQKDFNALSELKNLEPKETIERLLGKEVSADLFNLRKKLFEFSINDEINFDNKSSVEQYDMYTQYRDMVKEVTDKLFKESAYAYEGNFVKLAATEIDILKLRIENALEKNTIEPELLSDSAYQLIYGKDALQNIADRKISNELIPDNSANVITFFEKLQESVIDKSMLLPINEAVQRLGELAPLVNDLQRYEKLDGEVEARGVQVLNQATALGEGASKEAGKRLQQQMDKAYVTPTEGYLSNALNRLNATPEQSTKASSVSELTPERVDFNKEVDYQNINPRSTDLFINKSKVKTIEDYQAMLETFSLKKTFEGVQGAMIKGKTYDVETRLKLEETGRVMRAHKDLDSNYLRERLTDLLDWRAEVWRFTDLTSKPSAKEKAYMEKFPDASSADYERHVRDWITALGPVEMGQEFFTTNWETNKKAMFALDKRGRDNFKAIKTAKEKETLDNIQMAMDVLEGSGNALGKKPFWARLTGVEKEYNKKNFFSSLNLRTINQWGTANIYSITEDLSINDKTTGTFDSPLVHFVMDNMRQAENQEFSSKRAVLNILSSRMKDIYGVGEETVTTSNNPFSPEGPLSRNEGRILNKLRKAEKENTKEAEIDWIDEETGIAGKDETWTPNEAANLYIKTLDKTNMGPLQNMGIMKRELTLNEQYQSFEIFSRSPEFKQLEIQYSEKRFKGLVFNTVEQGQEAVKKRESRNFREAELKQQELYRLLREWKTSEITKKVNVIKKTKKAPKGKINKLGKWESSNWRNPNQARIEYKYSEAEKKKKTAEIEKVEAKRKAEIDKNYESELEKATAEREKALNVIIEQAKKEYNKKNTGEFKLTNKGKAIIKTMSPQLKEWADYIVNEFLPQYALGEMFPGHINLNDFHKDITGAPLNSRKYYSPAPKEMDSSHTEGEINVNTPEIVFNEMTSSYLKEKSENKQPLKKQDINSMVTKFIQDMEFFKAYQKPISNLHNVFNNKLVKEKIQNDFAPGLHSVLNRNLLDIAGKNKIYDKMQTAATWLRTNYVVGSLGGKPSLMFKQATSIIAYAGDMPTAEWLKTTSSLMNPEKENGITEWKKAYDTLMATTMMQKRYSRLEFDDAVRQVMGSDFENIPTHNRAVRKQLINAMMKPVVYGDRFAIVAGGWAVYTHAKNKALAEGKSIEEAAKEAEKKFESTTRLAQQASESSDLSIAQRHPYLKMFVMYKTSPMSYYRQSRAAMRAMSAGKGSQRENMKKFAIYNFILPQLFQAVSTTFTFQRDKWIMNVDDGEMDEKSKFSFDVQDMMRFALPFTGEDVDDKYGDIWKAQKRAGYLGSLNGVAIAGDVLTFMLNTFIEDTNYGFHAVPMESAVEAIGRGLQGLYNRSGELADKNAEGDDINWADITEALTALHKVADPVATMAGAPYRGVGKFSEGLYNLLHTEDYDHDPMRKVTPYNPQKQ